MSSSQLLILMVTAIIFTAYINLCTSDDEFDKARILPNISDTHSFLQFPGLEGAGGLDFSLYDAFASLVNKSRYVPNLIAQTGNYTLLQLWLMISVGATVAGVATLLAEALLYKAQDDYNEKYGYSETQAQYGPPITYLEQGPSNQYENPIISPPPSDSYGAPAAPESSPSSNSYVAPPSDNAYSAPPPDNTYGALPPSNSYGAPTSDNSYGAPKMTYAYGPPPVPPAENSYGSPPPFDSYGLPSRNANEVPI